MEQHGNHKAWTSLLCGLALLLSGAMPAPSQAAFGQNATGQPNGAEFSTRAPAPGKEYVFAIYPLHNPARLFAVYNPLIEYLRRNIPGSTFRLEASRNYEAFEEKLYGRKFDFALANPYQTLRSLDHGYHVIAKMGEDSGFLGVILTRRDSGIERLQDLKGKKVAYPARTALAAAMMPQYFFQSHGLDVNRDIENLYVGSQESSIMNVYLGNVAAGASGPLPWEAFQKEHPQQARELEVKWKTRPLVNNGVVARNDVPAGLARQVAQLLSALHESAEGRAILARMPLTRFERATDRRYRAIEAFLREFSRTVRPPDKP